MNHLSGLAAALKRGLRAISPDCREASRLQSRELDCPLSLSQRCGLRVHLVLCKWCRRYGKQLRFLRRALREHPGQVNAAPPETLSPEARERIRRSLGNGTK